MMTAGLSNECEGDHKVAANRGCDWGGVYGTFILCFCLFFTADYGKIYKEQLNEQASRLLEFNKFGLIFNYDLLGYGVMALSTFSPRDYQ